MHVHKPTLMWNKTLSNVHFVFRKEFGLLFWDERWYDYGNKRGEVNGMVWMWGQILERWNEISMPLIIGWVGLGLFANAVPPTQPLVSSTPLSFLIIKDIKT